MPNSSPIKDEPGQTKQSTALRLAAFTAFFKSYMNVAGVLLACVPIPVASWRLLPVFSAQRGYLTVYTSLFCFLMVAFVFSIRHSLAKQMFMDGRLVFLISALPSLFIVLTLACILAYHANLNDSLQQLRQIGAVAPTSTLLQETDYTEIPHSLALSGYYLGIFVFAECAFVLMALREYLQDCLGIDEIALLKGSVPPRSERLP